MINRKFTAAAAGCFLMLISGCAKGRDSPSIVNRNVTDVNASDTADIGSKDNALTIKADSGYVISKISRGDTDDYFLIDGSSNTLGTASVINKSFSDLKQSIASDPADGQSVLEDTDAVYAVAQQIITSEGKTDKYSISVYEDNGGDSVISVGATDADDYKQITEHYKFSSSSGNEISLPDLDNKSPFTQSEQADSNAENAQPED